MLRWTSFDCLVDAELKNRRSTVFMTVNERGLYGHEALTAHYFGGARSSFLNIGF